MDFLCKINPYMDGLSTNSVTYKILIISTVNKHKFVQKVAKDCIHKHSLFYVHDNIILASETKISSSQFPGPTFLLRSYSDFIQCFGK